MTDDTFTKAQASFAEHTDNFQSIVLATVNKNAEPNASYAPFVKDSDGNFYIFISGLSEHTRNLEETRSASILLLEDEKECSNIFARARLTYKCDVSTLEREGNEWEKITELFNQRFGKMVSFFKKSPDFRLMQLKPKSGLYVVGFGAAYTLGGEKLDELNHINDGGHSGHAHGAHSGHGAHGHSAHSHGGAHGAPHAHG